MKTFKDLTFVPHPNVEGGKAAFIDFDNERIVSVVTGASGFFTSDDKPYEVAFIKKGGGLGKVYLEERDLDIADKPIMVKEVILVEDEEGNDVAGYCTEEDVTLIMEAIQKL